MGWFPLRDSVSASLRWRISNDIHELELRTLYTSLFSFRAVLCNALLFTPTRCRVRKVETLNAIGTHWWKKLRLTAEGAYRGKRGSWQFPTDADHNLRHQDPVSLPLILEFQPLCPAATPGTSPERSMWMAIYSSICKHQVQRHMLYFVILDIISQSAFQNSCLFMYGMLRLLLKNSLKCQPIYSAENVFPLFTHILFEGYFY